MKIQRHRSKTIPRPPMYRRRGKDTNYAIITQHTLRKKAEQSLP